MNHAPVGITDQHGSIEIIEQGASAHLTHTHTQRGEDSLLRLRFTPSPLTLLRQFMLFVLVDDLIDFFV